MFHVSALKAYKYVLDHSSPPPLSFVIVGHVEYEVDCVSSTREKGKHCDQPGRNPFTCTGVLLWHRGYFVS